ncbi:LPS-assembly lipoprotein LptE [Neisseria weaveri]|uniref:LPS-assembly lipoprotein LptE n=1 Tax=Neisseria weaveri TaxID=28091 RepID=A0A448VHA4_9NEIS|nr:LPS assembly lipoprotein LptE [Neisseria weaveri]EGV36455.1 rare lipoprotein B family protein [Neisseria weaveri LMG 5135]EGV38567.1 rare lipoprotein B family protein [Neisseria weaveri ATCC 51223]VEJ49147.1 Rare lipoprotein B, putative [Neisseria weaveri]
MKKWIFLSVCSFALSACGFHLKGQGGLSSALPYHAWYVDGAQIDQALENALHRADGRAVSRAEAQASIVVQQVETRRDIYTITRAADINEYLLTLSVQAQAFHHGQPLGKPISVTVQRAMDYADGQVLGKQEEEALIWAEMRSDAAEQIVRRLSFLKAQ